MYNFSGIIFRIWGVCGISLGLCLLCILVDKPWTKKFKIKKHIVELLGIAFVLGLGAVYLFRIVSPGISSFSGSFVSTNRNSRVAPPLPVTSQYVFENEDGYKKVVYLDVFSKKKIQPEGFDKGVEYTIYFDEFTNVIVRVEEVK